MRNPVELLPGMPEMGRRSRYDALLLYNLHMAKFHTRTAGILLAGIAMFVSTVAPGQEERHGRKYVAPPPPAHISVTVTKANNGKPVANAAVIFHPIKNGKDGGNMEIKTNREGVATLDIMPIGDTFRLQVVADGFQTFGEDYTIDSSVKEIEVKMKKPVSQQSIYSTPPGSPATTTDGKSNKPSGATPSQ
jgi:Carboxypeptidase regulatory-like domain